MRQARRKGWQRQLRTLKYNYIRAWRFLRYDLWRTDREDVSGFLRFILTPIKVIYIAVYDFINENLISKASSLTYSTVLSIVPMLAVVIGIAKGFGMQNAVKKALIEAIPSHSSEIDKAFVYVQNYLDQVQGGLFLGLGFIILLYTVLMLISNIEDIFNKIWKAPFSRSWGSRVRNYLGIMILLPLFLTLSSGVTILSQTIKNTFISDYVILGELTNVLLKLSPYVMYSIVFISLYLTLPNVKVKFLPALIGGTVAGVSFQLFQLLYISGVLWISKYNAIYGSFAAFPLLLLWLQLSWVIALFGAQLAYSIQNVKSFAYFHSTKYVSRRYRDFVALVIIKEVCQRFASPGVLPYRVEELSESCKIPLSLAREVVNRMLNLKLLSELQIDKKEDDVFLQPAIDPDLLTVGYVLEQLDRAGSEDFKVDAKERFRGVWQALIASRIGFEDIKAEQKVRDL